MTPGTDGSRGREAELPRSASALRWLPEPLRYVLHPFLVHSRLDRLLMPRHAETIVDGADGARFVVDLNDEIAREILHFGAYEKRNIEIIRQLAGGRTGTFLDVGANIGGHTILLARHFGRLAAFEPNPAAFDRLGRNLALNRHDHVSAYAFGLSDADAELPFQVQQGSNPGTSRFLARTAPGAISLPVRNGDAVIHEHSLSPVAAIKVDVEGHEERVIAGLGRTIARDRPVLFFEWESTRNGRACFDRLPGYAFFAQPWELAGGQWRRPFARGLDAARPPRLVPVVPDALEGRYVSMVVALPAEQLASVTASHGRLFV